MRALIVILLALLGCSTTQIPRGTSQISDSRPEINLEKLEALIHESVNKVRLRHSLGMLAWNDSLAGIARQHSRDLAESGTFSHSGTDGSTPSNRAVRAGFKCVKTVGEYRFTGIAENLFMTYVYRSTRTLHGPGGTERSYDWKTAQDVADDVVEGWMGSAGHRANILEARHDRQGIGINRKEDRLYITQNLC